MKWRCRGRKYFAAKEKKSSERMCLFRSEEVKKELIFALRWRVEKRMYLYVFEVVKKRMYFAAEWKVEKRMYLYGFEVVGKECILLLSGE